MAVGQNVEIGKLQKELNRLWSEKVSAGQIKACLFNLVIFVTEEKRAAYLKELAHDILERFPCRIIFIKGDLNPTRDHLNIIATNEITSKNNRKIPCDEMVIDVGFKKLSRVPFLVIPHLVPDLPIYLLWGQDPTSDNKILPYLEKYATRLIFDSQCTNDLQRFSNEMLLLLDAASPVLMDFNWAHISGWRDVLSKVFNDPENLTRLRNARAIKIYYNKNKTAFVFNHEIKAIYYQGWLASRLGWKFTSMQHENGSRFITYMGPSHEVKIELIPAEETGLFPGALIRFEADTPGCQYQIVRKQQLPKVTVHVTSEDRCELPFTLSLPDLTRRSVFMREVFYTAVNAHYKQMLHSIAPIKWDIR